MEYLLIISYLVVVAGFTKTLFTSVSLKGTGTVGVGLGVTLVIMGVFWPIVLLILAFAGILSGKETIAKFLKK